MGNRADKNDAPPPHETYTTPFVGRLGERFARREFFHRTGKVGIGLTAASWILGVTPQAAAQNSPTCSGPCFCSGTNCTQAVPCCHGCDPRATDCPTNCNPNTPASLHCWTAGGTTCCDWYCLINGVRQPCRCCS
jgi:hypothetical protein